MKKFLLFIATLSFVGATSLKHDLRNDLKNERDISISIGGPIQKDFLYHQISFDSHVGMSKSDAISDPVNIFLLLPPSTKNVSVTWTPLDSQSIDILSAFVKNGKLQISVAFWGYRWNLFAGFNITNTFR